MKAIVDMNLTDTTEEIGLLSFVMETMSNGLEILPMNCYGDIYLDR